MSGSLRFLPRGVASQPATTITTSSLFLARCCASTTPGASAACTGPPRPAAHWLLKNLGPGTPGRRLQRRLPLARIPRSPGCNQDAADERAHRCGAGQHLRQRSPVQGWHSPDKTGRTRVAQALATTRRENWRCAGRSHSGRRNDAAGLRRRRRANPGTSSLPLDVYGRAGEPCVRCKRPIRVRTIGQRATYLLRELPALIDFHVVFAGIGCQREARDART